MQYDDVPQLASLRPPFTGDSFPSLKRSVTSGRYLPIPKKYSDSLSRVLGQMLRLNPRERPSADALLNSAELAPKLQLDEISTSFAPKNGAAPDLMETIKVPQNLRRLNVALPKPCYPDMRPNSPSAWTVAEQHKKIPTAGVALAPITESENVAPSAPATARSAQPTSRDDSSVASTNSAPALRKAPKVRLSEGGRAPLTSVNGNVDRASAQEQGTKYAAGRAVANRMNPQPPAAPLVSQVPGAYNRGRVAGAPSRANAGAQYRYW
jgi:serine/threonine protein kinase